MTFRYQIPLYTALAIAAVRFLVDILNVDYAYLEEVFLFASLAALPALTIYAIWPRGAVHPFFDDVKNALRYTALYTVAMVLIAVLYYSFIETSYFSYKHQLLLERALSEDPSLNPEEARQQIQSFFSLRNFAVLMLVGHMFAAVFYAFLFSAVKRLIPYKASR